MKTTNPLGISELNQRHHPDPHTVTSGPVKSTRPAWKSPLWPMAFHSGIRAVGWVLLWLVTCGACVAAAECQLFQTVPVYAGELDPISVVVADFNGDGHADLGVGVRASGSVGVLLGNGDGTLQAARIYDVLAAQVRSLVTSDFNRDGHPDLAVTEESGGVWVLVGNGDGTFQAAQGYSAGYQSYCVAVGDFNGDGKPDLAVANRVSDNLSVLLGNGDGTFLEPSHEFRVQSQPQSVAVGDFNGDNKLDLVAANYRSESISILLGYGDGTFQVAPSFGLGEQPTSVGVSDFNRDGKLDLVVAADGHLQVMLGRGDATFGGGSYLDTQRVLFAAACDLDGDSKPDLAAAIQDGVIVLRGNGDGTFQPALDYNSGGLTRSVAAGDFNGDGKMDLATDVVSILPGNGDGTLQAARDYYMGWWSWSVAAGDLNGDGHPDLAVASAGTDNVGVLLGNGDGSFQPVRNCGLVPGLRHVAMGDFNRDSKLDLVVASPSSDSVSVLLGIGDGTFQAPVGYGGGDGAVSLAVADLNGDSRLDLAIANEDASTVSVLLGNGDGTFQAARAFGAGNQPDSVAVGDFNGDNKPDLAVANRSSSDISVLLGNRDGTFQAARNFGAGLAPCSVATGDFNGDGHADLVVANDYSGTGTTSVLLGNGGGTFQAAQEYSTESHPRGVAVGDFNGDRQPDLAVANYLSLKVSVLLGNGNGTFQAARNYWAASGPCSVAISDFNGDGQPDLAVANQSSYHIAVLLGKSCQAPPIARCRDVTVALSTSCTADVSIDDGSFDPNPGDAFTVAQSPRGPYPPGDTVVTLTVTDNHGASASCSATVTVTIANPVPPTIFCPTNLVFDCGTTFGQSVTFTVTATNVCQPTVPVTCTPRSGTVFPLGTRTVTCVAVDALGLSNQCIFTVTVLPDVTPPELTCSSNIVEAVLEGTCARTVDYGVAVQASDACGASPSLLCVPPSGASFPVGTTDVSCTATDDSGNSNACAFSVTILPHLPFEWQQSYGGTAADELRFIQTNASGYLLGGYSASGPGGHRTNVNAYGLADYWLVGTDANGFRRWEVVCGGSADDVLAGVAPTADNGYLLGGTSASGPSGNRTNRIFGASDYWVVRLSATRQKLWDRAFGGREEDVMTGLEATSDGGFILGGYSASPAFGASKLSANYGEADFWVVKLNASGINVWDYSFGGTNGDRLMCVRQTSDHGFILAGASASPPGTPGNKTSLHYGGDDGWVVRLNSTGTKLWERSFGGTNQDGFNSVRQTADGGFILGGYSSSPPSASPAEGNKTSPHYGSTDFWVVRLDANGAKLWEQTFGGSSADVAQTLEPTPDGGFIVGGGSESGVSGNKTSPNFKGFSIMHGPNNDYWLVQLDANGKKLWEQDFGGTTNDVLYAVQPTSDGGLIFGGASWSSATGNKTSPQYGGGDFWVVKASSWQPPAIVCPANTNRPCANPAGEVVTFSVTATNVCQPTVPVTCTPPSGTTFLSGTTTVTCVAVDALGSRSQCSFTVTLVPDPTPPVVQCSQDRVVTAPPGECEAVAYFVSVATDNCDIQDIVCAPPSGATFPVGTNTVVCTAHDAAGNTASCSFSVFVLGSGSLAITCAPDVTVLTPPGSCEVCGLVLTPPSVSSPCGPYGVTSNAPACFPIGVSPVVWTATNTFGQTATCTQQVTVVASNQPPVITLQPQNQSVPVGGTATFRVVAWSCLPLSYQWWKPPVSLPGQTNDTLIISGVRRSDAGSYQVRVANAASSVASTLAVLVVGTEDTNGYPPEIVKANPLAYWRLGERTGTTAHDWYGVNDGTYYNAVLGQPGAIVGDANTAAGFVPAANSHVIISNPAAFNFTGALEFSLEAWVLLDAVPIGAVRIFSNGQGPTLGGYGFGVVRTQALSFMAYGLSGVSARSVSLVTNRFYHVVAVHHDTGLVQLYLDGCPVGLPLGPFSLAASTSPLHLGRNPNVMGLPAEAWPGRIDEAAVYDRALMASEVCAHYLAGLNERLVLFVERPDADHLVLRWTCGTLQEADAVTGPWRDVATASPYTLAVTAAQRFYQVRR